MKTASKITPGPWKVRQGGEHGRDPQAFDVVTATGYPRPIARGYWGGEADMTLCAASPDLLAACEALLAAYAPGADATAMREGEAALHSDVRKARAAIKKARGLAQAPR